MRYIMGICTILRIYVSSFSETTIGMSVLYIAFGMYIIGIGIVLYVRPSIMFQHSTWKEFGLNNSQSHTVFPFWMFTLIWAIISYAIATLASLTIAQVVLRSTQLQPNLGTPQMMTPISQVSQSPGYYVMDTIGRTPKYVYFGTSPPTVDQLLAYSR